MVTQYFQQVPRQEEKMGDIYKENGRLNIPIHEDIPLPKEAADEDHGNIVLNEAYCSNGHSLMSDVKIENFRGIQLIYRDEKGEKESQVVISSIVGVRKKVYLSGKPFEKGEIVKAFCPTCMEELPVLYECECGAHIYLFYIDKRLDANYGQSFCSRVGCVLASRLRFSCEMLRDFIQKYCF